MRPAMHACGSKGAQMTQMAGAEYSGALPV